MEQSPIEKLINDISKLPGLGRKSAQRIALFLLKNKQKNLSPFINTLKKSFDSITECNICGNIDLNDPCKICENIKRDSSKICIVEDVSDLWTFEGVGIYNGLYHVIGGNLSAINGRQISDLKLKQLVNRIENNKISEVVLALSTTMEGQTTSYVIADKLNNFKNLTISRLAQGIPMGGEVHYLDENTLNTAFQSRKKIT